jgi:hypothetical protein
VVDSKGRDFGCFALAKAEIACPKKKEREQAPALKAQLCTELNIVQIREMSTASFENLGRGAVFRLARIRAEQ